MRINDWKFMWFLEFEDVKELRMLKDWKGGLNGSIEKKDWGCLNIEKKDWKEGLGDIERLKGLNGRIERRIERGIERFNWTRLLKDWN